MAHQHISWQDYTCPRCKMVIQAYIPHECDPSICKKCDGKGELFVGRLKNRHWVGMLECDKCGGSGRITFKKEEG